MFAFEFRFNVLEAVNMKGIGTGRGGKYALPHSIFQRKSELKNGRKQTKY
jgi:hypothetical protein